MKFIVDTLALVGAWFLLSVAVLAAWVAVLEVSRHKSAQKTASPSASSRESDGRTPGLAAKLPDREQPAPDPPPSDAGTTRPGTTTPRGAHFGRDAKGNLTIVRGD